MTGNRHIYGLISFALLLIWGGCTDLRDQLPTPVAAGPIVHTQGWADTASMKFHGNAIREANWDMRSCRSCHGADYAGGIVQESCRTCHVKVNGPENCTTCHGGRNAAPPRDLQRNTERTARGVGAHQFHVVGGTLGAAVACAECHSVPSAVYVQGHIDSDERAEVMFGFSLANTETNEPTTQDYDLTLPLFSPMPSYDKQTLTCSNTYCHGHFKNGNVGSGPIVWNAPDGTQASCGTCHGDATKSTLPERALPKTSEQGGTHPNSLACSFCHTGVVDANGAIIDPSKHINGKLNVFGQERDY